MTVTAIRNDPMGPGMEVQTFDGLTLLGHRYWFRIVDTGNHEPLTPSQTYKTMQQRDKTAHRLGRAIGCPVVEGKRK